MNSFELLDYSPKNLAIALKNDFISVNSLQSEKFHYRYLLEYLGNSTPDSLSARTIVIENNYVSRSYLNDYSAYYSLCFSDDYKRKCKRVHFFNNSFNSTEFEHDIINNKGLIVNDSTYLGYIVVKNLPSVVIGATLLKTYNNSARFFVTKQCKVSLFGKLIYLDSLAFQEQDKVVSACATTALWIAFFKTSCYFQTPLPSPSEITFSAKNSFNFSGRTFPNKEGLDHFQIGNAIENVGLVFELRNKENINEPDFIKSFIYSYCKLGLPVLLGIDIENKGRHLITISGFKHDNSISIKRELLKVSLVSEELNMFYAHDDRIGPFSRLHILKKKKKGRIIETSWWVDDKGQKKHNAKIASIIVPLYKKIRITFEDILNEIRGLDYFFKNKLNKTYKLAWDIYLESSNQYKNEIILNNDLTENFKKDVLFYQLPKFIWIARLLINGTIVFELIFDSTDVSLGQFCLLVNCFDLGILETLKNELKLDAFRIYIKNELKPKYLELFDSLNNETPTCAHKKLS